MILHLAILPSVPTIAAYKKARVMHGLLMLQLGSKLEVVD